MIQLTRLNHHPLWVNSDLLKFVENTPDTVITLASGEKIVVLEDVGTIVDRLIAFRRRLLEGMSVYSSPPFGASDRPKDEDLDSHRSEPVGKGKELKSHG
jgi:flagellar protein FlbD